MGTSVTKFKTVDEYLAHLSPEKRKWMKAIGKKIRLAVPGAIEMISYNMPSFKYEGFLLSYAAWKDHFGLYPLTSEIKRELANDLAPYAGEDSTARFPASQPVPLELIGRIAKLRAAENITKTTGKKNKNPTLKTCAKGHQFHKSSDCPSCPICEAEKNPGTGFLSKIGAPARRALASQGINSLEELSRYSEKEMLALHGMGPKAVSILKESLSQQNLSLKKL